MRKVPETEHEALIDVLAHLVAATSLLKESSKYGAKKAAPSNKMFDVMIKDYDASINRARKFLKKK